MFCHSSARPSDRMVASMVDHKVARLAAEGKLGEANFWRAFRGTCLRELSAPPGPVTRTGEILTCPREGGHDFEVAT